MKSLLDFGLLSTSLDVVAVPRARRHGESDARPHRGGPGVHSPATGLRLGAAPGLGLGRHGGPGHAALVARPASLEPTGVTGSRAGSSVVRRHRAASANSRRGDAPSHAVHRTADERVADRSRATSCRARLAVREGAVARSRKGGRSSSISWSSWLAAAWSLGPPWSSSRC